MKYLDQLRATADDVAALADRTARLADFRRQAGRHLSGETRSTLATVAARLRATADRLDGLAVAGPDLQATIAAAAAENERLLRELVSA